jgi:hypothetical protein
MVDLYKLQRHLFIILPKLFQEIQSGHKVPLQLRLTNLQDLSHKGLLL